LTCKLLKVNRMFKRDHQNKVLQQVFVFVIAVLDVFLGSCLLRERNHLHALGFVEGGAAVGV